ncbi:MAG TPA: hypothetical protein VM778_04710 [Gemmatimonadota bacterium]|nr:hypothetical protein [Gemmatimonadota bacterium]
MIRLRLHAILLAAALSGAVPVAAQTVVTPADRGALALTVYSGWAQVRDTRAVAAPAGAAVVWTGVPGSADPATILPVRNGRPLSAASQVFEAGEDGASILRRSVGREAVLVWPDGTRQSATVVSADGPVLRIGDRLLVGWDGPLEVPDAGGLLEPAIRWTFAEALAGPLTAHYLADGLSWSADYVAILGEDESSMWLSGGATVRNDTDVAFPGARLELVAGEIRRSGGGASPVYRGERVQAMDMAVESAAPESFSDWYLYPIAESVTLPARSVARAGLFPGATIPIEREYILRGQNWWFHGPYPQPSLLHARIRLRFENRGVAGSDAPLPAGTIHTYLGQGSDLRFAGSAPVPHTPDGEEVEIDVGSAFDLVAERTQTDYRRLDPRTHETAWRIELRNRGRRARTVLVVEDVPGDWTIVEESRPHERVDATTIRWRVDVPAGGEAVLTYRVRSAS